MNDDLERQLERWGRSSPPAVNQALANRLESELRRIAAEKTRPQRRPIWQPLIGITAAAVLVVAGFLALDRDGMAEIVVLSTSENAVVILPDGTEIESPSELGLPEGSRIEIGSAGSATVGDVILGAGSVVEIVDGRVEVLSSPPAPTSATTVAPTADPSTTTQPTSTQPPTTADRATSVVDRTTTTSTGRPATTAAVEIRVVLTVRTGRSEVELSWTAADLDQITGWEMRALSGDRSATVAVLREPGARQLTLTRQDGSVTYRVLALGRDGVVLAESNSAVAG